MWDFGDCGVLSDCADNYVRKQEPMLYECLDDTCTAFFCPADTMLWAGFNVGRHTCFVLDTKVPVGVYKVTSAVFSHTADFSGGGLDADHRPFRLEGSLTADFIRSGKVLFRGDTLAAALHRSVVEWRDTLADGSEMCRTEKIYRWTQAGSEMTLAVLRTASGKLYCCDFGEMESEETDSGILSEDILNHIGYSLDGRTLTLLFPPSEGGAELEINVVDIDGISRYSKSLRLPAGQSCSEEVNLSALRPGRTLVVLRTLSPVASERKIAITL